MRVTINNRIDDMVARVCAHDLADELQAAGVHVRTNVWGDYSSTDVLVLRGADGGSLSEIASARAGNPKIRIFLSDPKMSSSDYLAAARAADVLIVSSVEQREAFLPANPNILIRYMFPRFAPARRERTPGPLRIGYHGNRTHIEAMAGTIDVALEALAAEVPCELVLIYNRRGHGRVSVGLPDPAKVPVRHVQWSWDVYASDLADCDIGLAPNLLPVARRAEALDRTRLEGVSAVYEPFDFLHRFKASSNPGRIYPYVWFGVPVVADLTPSHAMFLRDGESGFLCDGPHGWLAALRALAVDPEKRVAFAVAARETFETVLARRTDEFLAAAREPLRLPSPELAGASRIDEDLARYVPPPRPSVLSLLLQRWFG